VLLLWGLHTNERVRAVQSLEVKTLENRSACASELALLCERLTTNLGRSSLLGLVFALLHPDKEELHVSNGRFTAVWHRQI
jgi:hypothetical protein